MSVLDCLASTVKGAAPYIHRAVPELTEARAVTAHLGDQADVISESTHGYIRRDTRSQLHTHTSRITGLPLEEPTGPGTPGVAVRPLVDDVTRVASVSEISRKRAVMRWPKVFAESAKPSGKVCERGQSAIRGRS